MKPLTLGVIVGNRGFFPDHLVTEARAEISSILKAKNVQIVMIGPEETKLGGVETWEDAQKCGKLFKAHKDVIDGVLVTLPNFGDERAVANTMRLSELDVPILIHAYADDVEKMDVKNRRDSFCGKISVCNNLSQYNIPFTLTSLHTVPPSDPSFSGDLDTFIQTCRVVSGMKRVRVGAVGARTGPFNTVRYSEKILESMGISVETLDLSEVFGRAGRLKDDDSVVTDKVNQLKGYTSTEGVPAAALIKQAKLGVILDEFTKQNDLQALSIQCWTSMQEFYGVVPCSIMSMGSDSLFPNACEVDVLGAISMYVLQLASGEASALVDWNNNYKDDPDKAVIFHCSNLPKSIMRETKMEYQQIIAGSVGCGQYIRNDNGDDKILPDDLSARLNRRPARYDTRLRRRRKDDR